MKPKKIAGNLKDLKRQAEKALKKRPSEDTIDGLSPDEVKRLVHDLQVHQIELTMQNDQLRQTEQALSQHWSNIPIFITLRL